ncbi:MAG: ATP-binding protein, partial [Streptosporangiaceae bacterium]
MARQATPERGGQARGSTIREPGLVGRERELAALGRALAAPPAIVLVEGEAGIGKTRLVRESLASPAGRKHIWVIASCPPFRQPHTLGPVASALREAVDDVASLRPSALAGALRPLFPEWTAGLPPALEPAEDATAARHRVFCALAELLARLEVSVLVVEDAHWADEATLEFLLFLASRRSRQVSIVASWRPEDVQDGSLLPRLARLATGDAGVRLELRPLDVTQTARMVSSMLGDERVSAEFAAFMHRRTEGVPLAVEESVRLMADRGDVSRRVGRWVRRRLAEIAVPATVRDAVLERAGRLSADAGAVLQAVAVLTDPAGEATVRAVAGLPVGRARAGLCEALGSG